MQPLCSLKGRPNRFWRESRSHWSVCTQTLRPTSAKSALRSSPRWAMGLWLEIKDRFQMFSTLLSLLFGLQTVFYCCSLNYCKNCVHRDVITPGIVEKKTSYIMRFKIFFLFVFLSLHQYMQSWRPIFERSWCYYSMDVMRTDDSVMLTIPHAGRYSEGPFRCVSDAENVTEPDNSSLPLAFKVNCELIWLGAVCVGTACWKHMRQCVCDAAFPYCKTQKLSLFFVVCALQRKRYFYRKMKMN